MRLRNLAALLAITLPALAAPEACQVDNIDDLGWKAVRMTNAWVKLTIVPQLGGRLMQVTFGDHDYLFVNQQLKGQSFSPEVSAAQKRWFNYGGDKIWPMPEGSGDEQHWPGAEGAVLDSGAFTSQVLSKGETCSVRLTGPTDPFIGQQYIRDIRIGSDSPAISFHAVMKNTSGYPQEWSEQSVSQYNTADAANPAQPNQDFWAFTPVNPQSAYLNSYHVRTGMASSSGYSIRDGLFAVHSSEAGGEVWIDSPSEWLAVVDGSTRFAMVERFRYVRGAEYPGKATVIVYTTGTGRRGPQPPAESAHAAIHYMEAELNSPLIRLEPGESYAMDTEWLPARMGSELVDVTYAGTIGRPLTVMSGPSGLTLAGEFGVFFAGQLEARFYDQQGARLGTAKVQDVTPLEMVSLQQTVPAPAETARVSVHLIDRSGLDRGPLGETANLIGRPE
ncbi:MAG TPA: hypothetical protein VK493_06650 [Bryobacteraceae bacterium]|nr:hypothetical protein [Bryobacteraceae bacterium]